MRTKASEKSLERNIARIQTQLAKLGPMRPGSLSRQYNVCGTPGCHCKDPQNPRRHGPYYQLSYNCGGQKTTEFVRRQNLPQVRRHLANYKAFRRLTDQWIQLSLQIAKLKIKAPN